MFFLVKMKEESYLSLLIIYNILYQQTYALNEVNLRKSSDLHTRKKRIIDNTLYPTIVESIAEIPYIVNIQKFGFVTCGATILSPAILLTAGHCVLDNVKYRILSGSAVKNEGIRHKIIKKIFHPHLNMTTFVNDLVLLKIFPPIDFTNSQNDKIELMDENVPLHTFGTLSGWGCTHVTSQRVKVYPEKLRSIMVPIIDLHYCQRAYQGHISPITETNFCTLDYYGVKGSCHGDSGSPFVVNGKLVGFLSWSIGYISQRRPDVFIKVTFPEYEYWIRTTMFELRG